MSKRKRRRKPSPEPMPITPPWSPLRLVRTRLFQGVLAVGPVVVTAAILVWLYNLLRHWVIDPVARVVLYVLGQPLGDGASLPTWIENYLAPVLAGVIVLLLLYVMGALFQSQLHRAVDWVLLRVPVVTIIYGAVQKFFQTLGQQTEKPRFQRTVLVAFPHPGMRVPGFVMSTCRDVSTGKTVLCVYVPTTPVPSSGYMLLVPEEDVTELNWDLNDTLQAIVSGGISVPTEVNYFPNPSDARRAP